MNSMSPLELLLKYNRQAPRYTSYPPAPYFTRDPEGAGALAMVDGSNRVGPWNVSLYFHIPFCPRRCHFCGCHTEIGRSGASIRGYLDTLIEETRMLLPHLEPSRPVTQIHFGGGTPNAVPFNYLEDLLDLVRSRMTLEPDAEVAMECDPNLITEERIRELDRMGFNRLSFGIQDFNPKVLEAVNRRFPKIQPKELFRLCRELGFSGNNLDLIYGLPHQTLESFRETLDKAIDAAPDRISLFPYAHVPWVKGHQAVLTDLPMPDALARLSIALESRETLEGAGYVAVGMDQFARPGDELALAVRDGALHRNFQGYCHAGRAGQVYGLGASAITQLHAGYLQNVKDLEDYKSMVLAGRFPWAGAYMMRPEDIAVRSIINGLLCAEEADLEAAFAGAGVGPAWRLHYLAQSLERLAQYREDGLVVIEDGIVRLLGNGRYLARLVAAAFDPMLTGGTEGAEEPRYSKAV